MVPIGNVSPIKPAEADRYQWHFPVVTFHSLFFLSAPLPLRPSEGFSIGLLNNADPPPRKRTCTPLKPLTLSDSLLLSVHQWLQKALFIGDGEQCPTSSCGMSGPPLSSQPPQIIQPLSPMELSLPAGKPYLLNLNKMRIPKKCFTSLPALTRACPAKALCHLFFAFVSPFSSRLKPAGPRHRCPARNERDFEVLSGHESESAVWCSRKPSFATHGRHRDKQDTSGL